MWKSKNSIILTQVFTIFLMVVLLALSVSGYWLLKWYFGYMLRSSEIIWRILVPFYTCVPIGFLTLINILKLLSNIKNGLVFVNENVNIIRLFSWCLIFVGVVCFVAGFFYLPYFVFCGASLFMAAIMRVLKNVMQKAVEVKDENDMTI